MLSKATKKRTILVFAVTALFAISNVKYSPSSLSNITDYSKKAFSTLRSFQIQDRDAATENTKRSLSINLGGGNCNWTSPEHVDQDKPIFTTVITSYPGPAKRIAFLHLEGLTGHRAGDDFNLDPEHLAKKFAFLKTSYPHHEGIWSWREKGRQSILMLQNPRWAFPMYHNLIHEIRYALDWELAYSYRHRVFTIRSPIEAWVAWRQLRIDDEIQWWRWHLDYWMEGGILRDIWTHDLTSPEHYELLLQPMIYHAAELQRWQKELEPITQPYYDFHCGVGLDMVNCKPVAVADFDRMMDEDTGPEEVARFINAVEGKEGVNVIEEEARECVWRELIVKHAHTTRDHRDRKGPGLEKYIYKRQQLEDIISMLIDARLKYSSGAWATDPLAIDLVKLLTQYIDDNQAEVATMPLVDIEEPSSGGTTEFLKKYKMFPSM